MMHDVVTINNLSYEIYVHIFSNLPIGSLNVCFRISKLWYQIVNDLRLWEKYVPLKSQPHKLIQINDYLWQKRLKYHNLEASLNISYVLLHDTRTRALQCQCWITYPHEVFLFVGVGFDKEVPYQMETVQFTSNEAYIKTVNQVRKRFLQFEDRCRVRDMYCDGGAIQDLTMHTSIRPVVFTDDSFAPFYVTKIITIMKLISFFYTKELHKTIESNLAATLHNKIFDVYNYKPSKVTMYKNYAIDPFNLK